MYISCSSLSSRSIASLRLLYTKVKATISSISPVASQAVGVYVEQVEDTRETELIYSRINKTSSSIIPVRDINQLLADLLLIPKLSNLFDSFIWRDPMEDGKEPASLVTIQDANVLQKLLLRSSSCILCTASVTIVTTSISSCHVVNGMSWEGSFLHQLQPQPQPQ